MADFSRLPNEMISEIWSNIQEPEDVESFALVSKRIYTTGSPFIEEHNKLKREFSFFKIDSRICANAAACLLKKVLCRPHVALYVTHLSIRHFWKHWYNQDHDDGWGDAWPSFSDGHYSDKRHDQGHHDDRGDGWPSSGHLPYPDDVMALFVEAIQKSSFVHPDLVSYWIACVKEGDDNPILALLILLLPNLSTLSLTGRNFWEGPFQETIQRIAGAEKPMFLTRLVTVNFMLLTWEFGLDLNWLGMFAALPLVQSLNFNSVTIEQDDNEITEAQDVLTDSYNITEMTFSNSDLCPIPLFQLLETVKGLKVFSFVQPNKTLCRFEPFWIRSALVANAKHSLEYLKILPLWTQECGFLGTLRGFTALKEVEVNVRLLCRWPAFDRLAHLLPSSIEKLNLDIRYDMVHSYVPIIVEGIIKAKSRLTPHLKALKLTTNSGNRTIEEGRSMIKALKEECHNAGIELTFVERLGFK